MTICGRRRCHCGHCCFVVVVVDAGVVSVGTYMPSPRWHDVVVAVAVAVAVAVSMIFHRK